MMSFKKNTWPEEFSVLFDFIIIVLSLLDSLIIVQLRNAGVLNLDTSALSVLRAFRLFRLAKLLRVFKLFPQLQKMVFALIETWRQVGCRNLGGGRGYSRTEQNKPKCMLVS